MKYCYSCGCKVEENYKFCPQCGIHFEEMKKENVEVEEEKIKSENNLVEVKVEERKPHRLKYSIMSFAFGVTGLYSALCCFTPLVGLYICLPMFIVFTSLSKKYARTHYSFGHKANGFVKAGRIVSTVAIPVGIVFSVIGLFYTAFFLFV